MPTEKGLFDFKRDTQYWDAFYKTNRPESMEMSLFARFAMKWLPLGSSIVDMGCGNGRDSLFFAKNGMHVLGVDASSTAINLLNNLQHPNAEFICGDFISDARIYSRNYDCFYSRFTLHAISFEQQKQFVANVFNSLNHKGMFMIEVRGVNDPKFGQGEFVERNAYILDGHYRRFIVMEEILTELITMGFVIKYAEENTGFAPYGDENPEIIRIIAKRL
ncbi:MAG: class I SAM-dependent methyltransferase [Salinivirgaceae bacterium]|nr:class I SAM-dependent methyltransferase [Salinivirgaceae bacterium]